MLRARFGIELFYIATRGDVNDPQILHAGGTERAEEFVQYLYHVSLSQMAEKQDGFMITHTQSE